MEFEEKNDDMLDEKQEETVEEKQEETPEEILETGGEETAEAPVPVAPFLTSGETTASIMKDVVIGLLPAALFGVYRYGFRAFLILLLSVTTCVLAEHICKRVKKLPNGGYECSAVVTGLLFGMMLPVEVPYWIPVAGGAFAILLVKMLFGGLGRNRLNPAATAKCAFLVLATFLLKEIPISYRVLGSGTVAHLKDMFFGFFDGMVGEVSAFLVLLGGLYLALFKIIKLRATVAYLTTFVLVLGLFGEYGFDPIWLGIQICSGSVMLGAFFLINDYTTSPMTATGKVLYGILTGALTGVLRIGGYMAVDVVLAVIIGNLFVPVFDRITLPRAAVKEK